MTVFSELCVIAEAGVNHNGDLERAKAMVKAAAEAGADYVKFQAFRTDDLVAQGTRSAAYQADNTGQTQQSALLGDLELDLNAFALLAETCRDQGIGFMATAFDSEAIESLIAIGMDRIKVASGELTNVRALSRFAGLGLPVILSTGMANMEEIGRALALLRQGGCADIALLHCTSLYPAPPETMNLRAMATMAAHFGVPIGLSDHSLGDHGAIAAVALGARVIEKHFTLDRTLPGPDHRASLEPDELSTMIARLHEVQAMLGDGRKRPSAAEKETARLVRRSWHMARDLPKGHVLRADDLVLKRPASGIPPWQSLDGRVLARALRADMPVSETDLAPARAPALPADQGA